MISLWFVAANGDGDKANVPLLAVKRANRFRVVAKVLHAGARIALTLF